ncbi:hypothetical protein DPMN_144126 [Dreissena polymorpha]|uniref:Uncharacterized protein n=1 Tax=Dreissena polymorpha TaxID=45954 RepID=A0A9D4JNW2_DREPO|nr:hypothetical protein DPMN_144126 [Dreissena polymorpha]
MGAHARDTDILQALIDQSTDLNLHQVHDKTASLLDLVFTTNPSLIKLTERPKPRCIADHDIEVADY